MTTRNTLSSIINSPPNKCVYRANMDARTNCMSYIIE